MGKAPICTKSFNNRKRKRRRKRKRKIEASTKKSISGKEEKGQRDKV